MDLQLKDKLALVSGSTAGIGLASVLPGPTRSRGVGDFVDTLAKSTGQSFDEVATMVAYVASPLASATTGAALRVDGGVIKSAF